MFPATCILAMYVASLNPHITHLNVNQVYFDFFSLFLADLGVLVLTCLKFFQKSLGISIHQNILHINCFFQNFHHLRFDFSHKGLYLHCIGEHKLTLPVYVFQGKGNKDDSRYGEYGGWHRTAKVDR